MHKKDKEENDAKKAGTDPYQEATLAGSFSVFPNGGAKVGVSR